MMSRDADYTIDAYYPPNRGGGLAIATWHIGESSRDTEIEALKARMRRGEIGRIVVTNRVPPYGSYTIYAWETT